MGMEAIVVLVVTITQLGKSWLKTWLSIPGDQWKKWYSVIVSLVVSFGVVIYNAARTGAAFNLDLLWVALGAFALANGAKKIVGTLKPK